MCLWDRVKTSLDFIFFKDSIKSICVQSRLRWDSTSLNQRTINSRLVQSTLYKKRIRINRQLASKVGAIMYIVPFSLNHEYQWLMTGIK